MVDVATAVPSVPLQPTAKPPQISWSEPRQSFVVLALINTLLRVATLGVYHFWGKTEVRQRIWSAVRVDGEPKCLNVETIVVCAGKEQRRDLVPVLAKAGIESTLIGGADAAAELDAKRAIEQGTRVALAL